MKNTHNVLLNNRYTAGETAPSQEGFMMRNRVAPTYRGPIFVVEDVWVPCALCRAAVDPVVRIPVGSQWFHPQCLRCTICKLPSKTNIFHAVRGQPTCADCINRGFAKSLPKLAGRSGNGTPQHRTPSRGSAASRGGGSVTPRRALSPLGYSPSATPTSQRDAMRITSTPFLDSRALTRRQKELLDRQRLVTEGDHNILLLMPSLHGVPDTPTDGQTSPQPIRAGGSSAASALSGIPRPPICLT